MKIDSTGRIRQTTPARKTAKTRAAAGSSFQDALKDAAAVEESVATAPVVGAAAVDALLAIQEVDAVEDRQPRARARRRGEALLDRLEELRLALLTGGIPADRLRELATMIGQGRQRTDDPGLDQVLDEIELRVRVELAKLGL
jgi:hypothetical protein